MWQWVESLQIVIHHTYSMLAKDLAIMWRQYVDEPIYCISHMPIPEDQIPGKDYSRILGYHYIQNLLSKCGISKSCYPVRRNTQLYFLFIFKGSNCILYDSVWLCYLVWWKRRVLLYSIWYTFLLLYLKRECRIRFNRKKKVERMEHKFRIKLNS